MICIGIFYNTFGIFYNRGAWVWHAALYSGVTTAGLVARLLAVLVVHPARGITTTIAVLDRPCEIIAGLVVVDH